jgi:hypothetical protein
MYKETQAAPSPTLPQLDSSVLSAAVAHMTFRLLQYPFSPSILFHGVVELFFLNEDFPFGNF